MKNFNKKIFSLNISSLQKVKSEIPKKYFNKGGITYIEEKEAHWSTML